MFACACEKPFPVGRVFRKKTWDFRGTGKCRIHEWQLVMKKVNKIGVGRLALFTMLQMILEFYELRFGDLPACCECTKLLEIFRMRTFMIQHRWPLGSIFGGVPSELDGDCRNILSAWSPR